MTLSDVATSVATCVHPTPKNLGDIVAAAGKFRWCSRCGAMAFGEAWITPEYHELLIKRAGKGDA
jgi:hypothetical protein